MARGKKGSAGSGDAAIRDAEKQLGGAVVDPVKLLPILEDIKSLESEIAETRGDMSGYWKRYEEAGGIKDVGRVVKKLSKMTESQRADWLRQFDAMRLSAFGGDTADMFDEKPASNVVQGPGAAAAAAPVH